MERPEHDPAEARPLTLTLRTLTHQAAMVAVSAAVEKGVEIGRRVNAAVVDAGGNLLAFLRCPGAPLHSISIAEDKAYTAVSFGVPTADLFNVIKDSAALREGLVQRPRLIVFGGGHPIVADGAIAGGIGVSGASEDEDNLCAKAGLDALRAMNER
jgi:uncharacterized protein GlcG (DUF336 family)